MFCLIGAAFITLLCAPNFVRCFVSTKAKRKFEQPESEALLLPLDPPAEVGAIVTVPLDSTLLDLYGEAKEILAIREGVWKRLDPSGAAHFLRLHATTLSSSKGLLAGWLVNDRQCRDHRLPLQPVLIRTKGHVGYRLQQNDKGSASTPVIAGEAHVDQIIAALAESGVRSNQPVYIGSERLSVADLIADAARTMRLDREIEWTVIALALYLPHVKSWRSVSGDLISWVGIANELVDRIEAVDASNHSCSGIHALYALTILLRINQQYPLWDDTVVENRVVLALRKQADLLVQSQLPDGSWSDDWRLPKLAKSSSTRASLERQLLLTGHHLEWLAIAPEGLLANSQVLSRAAGFIVEVVAKFSIEEAAASICPVSHGIRAIALVIAAKSGNNPPPSNLGTP